VTVKQQQASTQRMCNPWEISKGQRNVKLQQGDVAKVCEVKGDEQNRYKAPKSQQKVRYLLRQNLKPTVLPD